MENYLIYDIPEQMVIASHISTYLINKFSYNVLIITKETIDRTHFKELGNDGKIKLSLIVAGDLKTLLKKLLYLDNLPASRLPRLLILDSLHLWFAELEPSRERNQKYAMLIAAFQNLVDNFSRLGNKTCISFLIMSAYQFPSNLAYNFYHDRIKFGRKVDDVQKILDKFHD